MPGGGSGSGGVSHGPTPWWQLPEYGTGRDGMNSRDRLERSAPPGYEYDPVQMAYTRTPTSAGNRESEYRNAAMGNIQQMLGGLFGGGGSGGTGGGGGVTAPANVPQVQAPDLSAQNAAVFGRAKDQAAQMARSSLDSLAGELGGQGLLGSGAQFEKSANIVSDSTNLVGEASRNQAAKEADVNAQWANTRYQGEIAQRGQNIQAQEAQARLAAEERARQMDMLRLILGSLGTGGGQYGQPVGPGSGSGGRTTNGGSFY